MKHGKTLSTLLGAKTVYAMPLFQRYYSWKEGNRERLWDDIVELTEKVKGEMGSPQRKPSTHFMGAIVIRPTEWGEINRGEVIDGQQRLLTLSILLCALRNSAYDQGKMDFAKELEERYLIITDEARGKVYRLSPRFGDRVAYQSLVSGERKGDSEIFAALRYFHSEIEERVRTDEDFLGMLRKTVLERLEFMQMLLEEGEDPYKIFRALNDTGVDLRAGDLIRNHVFNALRDDKRQEEFDRMHWLPLENQFKSGGNLDNAVFEEFFRSTLLREGKHFRKSDTYGVFAQKHPESCIAENPTALAKEYCRLARYWQWIKDGVGLESKDVQDAVNRVGELSIGVAYPLVMRLLEMREAGDISNADTIKACHLISGFFLRRHICGKNSRGYDKWFCEACRILDENPLANLKRFLVDQKGGWPKDSEFKDAFIRFGLYESRYCVAVLRRMEKEWGKTNPSLPYPINLAKCEIEHIMPRSIEDNCNGRKWQGELGGEWRQIHRDWVHTPGNLTLIGPDYNKKMSNKWISEKIPALTGGIHLNEHFKNHTFEKWGAEEIEARGKELAEFAAKIWCGPDGS